MIGVLPGGNSSSTLTSKSPYTVIAAVRGMGVAVITNTSGISDELPFSRRAARCSTPKRCCSSITTTPRLANCTDSSIKACVPITMSMSPCASSSSTARRRSPVTRDVSSSTRSGRSPNKLSDAGTIRPSSIRLTPLKCCSANTSVGAMSAPWCPPCTAISIEATATTVFPLPTSPCSRRCIGAASAKSVPISAITRFCALVMGKGSAFSNRFNNSPFVTWRIPRWLASYARLRPTSTSCTRSNSSKAKRLRACSFSSIDCGR